MTKTYVQILFTLLLALFIAGGAVASETKDDDLKKVKPMQCIWFLQNCAPPPPHDYAEASGVTAKQD